MVEKQVTDFYDQIAEDYNAKRFSRSYYRMISEYEQVYVSKNIIKGASVLEVGPGTGRFTAQIVKKAASVKVVDVSEKMLEQVHQNVSDPKLSTYRMSVYNLEDILDYGHFDVVVCMRVLPHLENPLGALSQMAKAIKPNGRIIFDLWNIYSFVGAMRILFRRPSYVYTKFYSFSQMLDLIGKAGLRVSDSISWGYPRIGVYSLDVLGNLLAKPFGYSHIFNVFPNTD